MDKKDALRNELLEVQRTLGWMDLVLANISEAVCVVNADFAIVFTNDAFAKLMGMERVFLLGQKLTTITDLNDNDSTLAEKLASGPDVIARAELLSGIYEWQAAESVFQVTARSIPTLGQAVFVLHDITQEYELDRMKSEFISLASHQLRTPLSTIHIYSQMLKENFGGQLSGTQKLYTDHIVTAAYHAKELVDNLLDVAKLEKRQTGAKLEAVSLPKTVEKILEDLHPLIEKKQLQVTFNKPDRLPKVISTPMHVREIFSNLIMNSIQYSYARGEIMIDAAYEDDQIITQVQDQGIGIPKASQKELFAPFYRAANADEHFAGGTGLGLYVVQRMVEELRGRIWFESEQGKGTSFFVTLPVKQNKARAKQALLNA